MRDRLYRSRDERVLFGVAGGVAEWLDVDPALVRIVWALLFFAGGIGLLLYIVMAFVIPEEPEGYVPVYGSPYAPSAASAMSAGDVPGGASSADAPTTSSPVTDPVTGQPLMTPPPIAPPASGWEQARTSRYAEREARRAARRARRGDREGSGAIVLGVVLVLVGAWFLARQYLPFFDTDLLWPVVLIVVGILVVVMAVRRTDHPS